LVKSVGLYFRLNEEQMEKIIQEVLQVTKNWKIVAIEIGICKSEQELMENEFNFLMKKNIKKITLKLYYLE
jgi:serine/threonine-protein kinase HipA